MQKDNQASATSYSEMAFPSLDYRNSTEKTIQKLSTQIYTKIQLAENDYLSDKYHDIRTLMNNGDSKKQKDEKLENMSWKYEEFELSVCG